MNKKRQRAISRLCHIFGGWPPIHCCPLRKLDIWSDIAALLRPDDDVEVKKEEFNKEREQTRRLRISRKFIAHLQCLDCGINVVESADYCMLNFDLWKRQLHLKWDDNLASIVSKSGLAGSSSGLIFIGHGLSLRRSDGT
jgi:hypothetical protein